MSDLAGRLRAHAGRFHGFADPFNGQTAALFDEAADALGRAEADLAEYDRLVGEVAEDRWAWLRHDTVRALADFYARRQAAGHA